MSNKMCHTIRSYLSSKYTSKQCYSDVHYDHRSNNNKTTLHCLAKFTAAHDSLQCSGGTTSRRICKDLLIEAKNFCSHLGFALNSMKM
uniref:Uncharacterized protein n=1 Tax=Anguilla anguilla TaxID=7936 RepID=A0A0E9XEJ3_ANGAN